MLVVGAELVVIDVTGTRPVTTPSRRQGRRGRQVAVVSDDEIWAILVAGLVATAIKVLDGHPRDRANTCRECREAWPCKPVCTAEMNLALVRA